MANLCTKTISTDGEYITLAEATGITFTVGNNYMIQIQNVAYLREGTVDEGFMVNDPTPIPYEAKEDELYIRAQNCKVNISE